MNLFVLNEIDIVYKHNPDLITMPTVHNSAEAHDLFRQNWDKEKIALLEQFHVLHLNRANRVLGITTLSSGGISGTVVDPKILFATAIKSAACSIILAHNHPSGNLRPSEADKKLQQRLIDGGKLLSIEVLDHLILSGIEDKYYSMADNLTL
jgi:DNA repair protein RadC